MKKIYKYLCKGTEGIYFPYLLLLNLLGNLAALQDRHDVVAIMGMVSFAVCIAYVENLALSLFGVFNKKVRTTVGVIFIIFHNVILLTEGFLMFKFHLFINQVTIDIMSETTAREVSNFISTYLDFTLLLGFLIVVLGVNAILYSISKISQKIRLQSLYLSLVFVGISIFGFYGVQFVRYGSGMGMPQFSSLTRLGYSLYVMKQRASGIERMCALSKKVEADSDDSTGASIVVVLGESYSLYHSQLYGYGLPTTPFLCSQKAEGALLDFDNAVTISPFTHGAMKPFSLGLRMVRIPTIIRLFLSCFVLRVILLICMTISIL